MFKIGDILKIRMDVAEDQYNGCKGTIVYEKAMRDAENFRFEVLDVLPNIYKMKRIHDKKEGDWDKTLVESSLELATESSSASDSSEPSS